MKRFQLFLALLAVCLSAIIFAQSGLALALVCITLVAFALNAPSARLCANTLSVPEILADVLKAFFVETPELASFSQDFSSNTAVLGDKVTAKISHIPVTGAYDQNNGGFKAASQDVITLIEDVPVTLNQLRCVTVKIAYLTGLATKGVPLYKAAVANIGFALGKYVVDSMLTTAVTGAVSNSLPLMPALVTLDTFDGDLRNQCNAQKMFTNGRFLFINSTLAKALGADDRVRSELFYGQLNGENGFRRWKNLGGFAWVREYADFPGAGINAAGLAGDKRLAVVATRKIHEINNDLVTELGIPKVMDFTPVSDKESGLELTGVSWQEQGTGDTYLSVAILFGTGVGNQGGAAGSMTDNAGLFIRTQ